MRGEEIAPTEAAVLVQVTALMNPNSTHNELWVGQLVAWPKKDMAIFQSEPVVLHLGKQSECKHEIKTSLQFTHIPEGYGCNIVI